MGQEDSLPSVIDQDVPSCDGKQTKIAEPDVSFQPTLRFYAAFFALSVMTLAAAFDETCISVALPIITEDLHGQALDAFWTGTSFLIAAAVLQPSWISFSEALGRRNALLISMGFFALGVIVCGTAQHFTQMLVGRSLQGVGSGGIMVLSEVLITDLVPLRERPKFVVFITGAWAIGSLCGPLLGGAFAHHHEWRWLFWINLPIIAIGFVLVVFFLKLKHQPGTVIKKLKAIDWIGFVFFIASITAVLVPITWGGVVYRWSSWHTLVPLCVGLAGLLGFGFYTYSRRKNPHSFLPAQIFQNTSTVVAFFQIFLQGIIIFAMLYYLPLYYEGVHQYKPIIAGIAMFPQTLTTIPSAIVVGGATTKSGRYVWALWAGWTVATLGCGIMYLLDVRTSIVQWIFLTLIAGIGTGMLYPGTIVSVMASTPQEYVGVAAGMSSFFRTLGMAVGVALGGTIFQNRFKHLLESTSPQLAALATQYSTDATAVVQVISQLPPGNDKFQLEQNYADALKVIWAVMCGIAALALITCFFVREYTMDVALQTDQGFDHGRKGKDSTSSG